MALARDDVLPGAIVGIQTFGELVHYHAHIHVIATDGAHLSSSDGHEATAERLAAESFWWHPSKRALSNRAWLLLILQKPIDAPVPIRIADLLDALSQLTDDQHLGELRDDDTNTPCCPHCGSARTRLLGEWPRFGIT